MDYLAQHIESLIFTSPEPVSRDEIKHCLEETFEVELTDVDVENSIEQLVQKYREQDFSFEIMEIAGGFQFLSKGVYHETVGTYLKQTMKKRLSRAALESLAIVAYKQPVTRADLESIRGVNCDYSIQKLLEKELITIDGRSDLPGKPLIYKTSEKFMDYFGLKSIDDLPKLKDFKFPENEIGEIAPIEEYIPSDGKNAKGKAINKQAKDGALKELEKKLEAAIIEIDPVADALRATDKLAAESIENFAAVDHIFQALQEGIDLNDDDYFDQIEEDLQVIDIDFLIEESIDTAIAISTLFEEKRKEEKIEKERVSDSSEVDLRSLINDSIDAAIASSDIFQVEEKSEEEIAEQEIDIESNLIVIEEKSDDEVISVEEINVENIDEDSNSEKKNLI